MNSITQRIEEDFSRQKTPTINNLDDLISNLREAFKTDHINIEYIQMLMESYQSNPQDWQKFTNFDKFRYTRNLIDEGNGKYNLILVCWEGGHASPIHDHSDCHCFMKVFHGCLSEIRFAWPEDKSSQGDNKSQDPSEDNYDIKEMKETRRDYIKDNIVSYMNDDLGLHRVENASQTEQAVSLHLYCPGISTCTFDQRTGHKTKCQVTFWSKYGEKVSYRTDDSDSISPPVDN